MSAPGTQRAKSRSQPPVAGRRVAEFAEGVHQFWKANGPVLVGLWLAKHGLPSATPWLKANLPRLEQTVKSFAAEQPEETNRAEKRIGAPVWRSLGQCGRSLLWRLESRGFVPASFRASDVADVWMSSGLVTSAADPTAAATGQEQGVQDTRQLARQLGMAVMLLGRLGLGAGRRITKLLALDPASGELATPALCEAALAAIEDLPSAESEGRPSGEAANSPSEQMAVAAAAAGKALATSGGQARASMAAVADRPRDLAEPKMQLDCAENQAATSPLQPTREPSARVSDAPKLVPFPVSAEGGRPANIEGLFVQANDCDSVWCDLVAETNLWRRFEVPDEVPDEVFHSLY